MADIITLLPDHVANQIAAGEVIQRPASVVKELLENAIDAQATDVQLLINGSGKTLIQVIDNGIGMSPTDLRLSFERHATSKIKSADDLFSIRSKGFRGEALASIAAIAQVEVHSKTAEGETASCVKISGSKIEEQEVSVAPTGTSIAVKNLFFNVPARRNFLKSDKVELRHIIDEFHRVALTHPEVKFSFLQNGSELFDLPAGSFKKRIANIFGNKIEEKLIPVEEMTTVAGIEGFVVKPEFAKKSRGTTVFFLSTEGLLKVLFYTMQLVRLSRDCSGITFIRDILSTFRLIRKRLISTFTPPKQRLNLRKSKTFMPSLNPW